MKNNQPKDRASLVLGLLSLIFISLLVFSANHYKWTEKSLSLNSPSPTPKVQTQPGYYQVTKFTDGDTIDIDLNGTKETIRLIGVDTPETHDPRKNVQCFGQAAAAFTKNLIGSSPVRLEPDPLNADRDKYNRLLRYVYLPDNSLVNKQIISEGYGFAYLSFPFSKIDEFKSAQSQAQTNNKGLWGTCQPVINQSGGYTSNDAQ